MKHATSIEVDPDAHVTTFGGEYKDDDTSFASYGIQIGSVTIDGLTPKQTVNLAIMLTDQLMLNGHSFKIVRSDHQDQDAQMIYTPNHNS